MALKIIPLELSEANALVMSTHRHHDVVVGHRFSIGCYDTHQEKLVGAAIVGRPVARKLNQRTTVEVTRLVTDGTKNACSFLYSAAARIAKELGYHKIQTYILETEPGISLIAAGWDCEDNNCGGNAWKRPDGDYRRNNHPLCKKQRYAKVLNPLVEFKYQKSLFDF